MPYKSVKQQRYFHANEGKIGKKVVDEFDQATKGKYGKLPLRVKKKKNG